MKLKNMWKRFWTLDVHNHEGFTLVELIIVIAILAILSTGAIAGYSAYVTSANKTADKAMIAEIENVLLMAYYNGDLKGNASVKLDEDGVVEFTANAEQILRDAYGANWEDALKLKYSDWAGVTSDQVFAEAYRNSSFNGNEDVLINQLGSVTNLLKDALGANPDLVGSGFAGYLDGVGVKNTQDNTQAVSNAALLYAADTIGKLDATKTEAVNKAFADYYDMNNPSKVGNMTALTAALQNELGTYGAAAALYAHGEAFGQYVSANGNSDLLEDFHDIDVSGVNNTTDALMEVANNLDAMVQAAQNDPSINPHAMNYINNSQYANDVSAYLETMKKIDANANKFTGNLGNADCYTDGTAAALLQAAIAAGAMNVSCSDGQVAIWITDGVTGNTVTDIQD